MTVLAHGVGSRADLPVPLTLALYGAGLAVLSLPLSGVGSLRMYGYGAALVCVWSA